MPIDLVLNEMVAQNSGDYTTTITSTITSTITINWSYQVIPTLERRATTLQTTYRDPAISTAVTSLFPSRNRYGIDKRAISSSSLVAAIVAPILVVLALVGGLSLYAYFRHMRHPQTGSPQSELGFQVQGPPPSRAFGHRCHQTADAPATCATSFSDGDFGIDFRDTGVSPVPHRLLTLPTDKQIGDKKTVARPAQPL